MFDIITIGTATLDVYLVGKYPKKQGGKYGDVLTLPLGGKLDVDDLYIATGGGATNTAVTFARQGFRVGTIAKLGDDIPGSLIRPELEREKIKPLFVVERGGRTAYSTILLTSGGERTIMVYRGSGRHLAAHDIPMGKLAMRWVYIAGGGIQFPLLRRMVNFFHKQGVSIAINPGKAQLNLGLKELSPIFSKTRVVILNREEASRLARVPYVEGMRIFRALDRAVGGIVVMTEGKRGVLVSDGISQWRAGTFRERKVVDRTGAGDAFGSGFVAGLMQKGEACEKGVCRTAHIAYAIRLASANATANIESIGAKSGLLTKQQFRASRWKRLHIFHSVLRTHQAKID